MSKPNAIDELLEDVLMWGAPRALKADELDKMWADFGRTVHHNMMRPGLILALNRACLTAKSHIELAAIVRIFLLTGVAP